MGGLISYLAHRGIVRVLSVPAGMAIALYIIWMLAGPPSTGDDDNAEPHAN